MTASWLVWLAGAYVIGSIPFGVIIGRLKGIDIRQLGSKNIGATNVGRVMGKPFGIACFVLDFLKGAGPVLAAGIWNEVLGRPARDLSQTQMWLWMAVALAAVLGHMFSLFLGFRGGKGVATGFGSMAAMWPLLTYPTLVALAVWYLTIRLTRYVSIASMLAIASLPVTYLLSVVPPDATERPLSYAIDHMLHAWPPFAGTAALAALVIFQHRGNIARLQRGEEPKVTAPRPSSADE